MMWNASLAFTGDQLVMQLKRPVDLDHLDVARPAKIYIAMTVKTPRNDV